LYRDEYSVSEYQYSSSVFENEANAFFEISKN
jgi:hypothetical protein